MKNYGEGESGDQMSPDTDIFEKLHANSKHNFTLLLTSSRFNLSVSFSHRQQLTIQGDIILLRVIGVRLFMYAKSGHANI